MTNSAGCCRHTGQMWDRARLGKVSGPPRLRLMRRIFTARKMILYAAKAKIAAGPSRRVTTTDHHASDEADRLMKEDPDIKKCGRLCQSPA